MMERVIKIIENESYKKLNEVYKEQNEDLYQKLKSERNKSHERFILSFTRLQKIKKMKILLSDLRDVVVDNLENASYDEEISYYKDFIKRIDEVINE